MKTWLTCLFAAMTLVLAGCNTVAGVGKDVQRAGETLEGAAKKK